MKKLIEFKNKLQISKRVDGTSFIHTNINDCNSKEWGEVVNHLNNMMIGQEWPPEIIDIIEEMEGYNIEDIEGCLYEIAESQVYIYHHDLAKWAFENHDIIDELTEVLEPDLNEGIYTIYRVAMSEYCYNITQYLYNNFLSEGSDD